MLKNKYTYKCVFTANVLSNENKLLNKCFTAET